MKWEREGKNKRESGKNKRESEKKTILYILIPCEKLTAAEIYF